jgi:EAL domain-containing protein (putative c-di-GMP-specific phosphodiesterase class I)
LQRHACDECQGFYFSKPMPAEKFGKMIGAPVAATA